MITNPVHRFSQCWIILVWFLPQTFMVAKLLIGNVEENIRKLIYIGYTCILGWCCNLTPCWDVIWRLDFSIIYIIYIYIIPRSFVFFPPRAQTSAGLAFTVTRPMSVRISTRRSKSSACFSTCCITDRDMYAFPGICFSQLDRNGWWTLWLCGLCWPKSLRAWILPSKASILHQECSCAKVVSVL